MPGRVLIAEEDVAFGKSLALRLADEGFIVSLLPLILSIDDLLDFGMPDIAIIGTCLAGVSAVEICRRLRAKPTMRNLPIVCLVAPESEAEMQTMQVSGIDDCAVKPVPANEIVNRIKRILRYLKSLPGTEKLAVGDLILDTACHKVFRQKRELKIGPTEYRLLEYMMQAQGRICSRDELKKHLWGADTSVDERAIDVHVGRLRRAIQLSKQDRVVETVRGKGYVLGNFR